MMPSIPQLLILAVVLAVIFALPFVVFAPAAQKAGYSKWWSLLLVVPVVNIVVIWVFSSIRWPVEKGG